MSGQSHRGGTCSEGRLLEGVHRIYHIDSAGVVAEMPKWEAFRMSQTPGGNEATSPVSSPHRERDTRPPSPNPASPTPRA